MSGFGKIYESSNWGVGVCDNTIGWGSSYKSISNCSDASFSYSADSFAQDGSNPTPTITGDAGGTFTATPAGLSFNSSTGLITLSTSSVNSYTVKYELSDGTFTEQSLAITAASFANVNSFSFDGVDEYMTTGLNLAYTAVPTFSISYWIKTSASFTNFASYFAVAVNVSYAGGSYLYAAGRLFKSQHNGLLVIIQGDGSSSGSTALDDGDWHNIIQVYTDNGGGEQRVRIYVDGNTTPEADLAATHSYIKLTGDLFIGARNASNDRAFPGLIDEVSVFNTDQTSNVSTIYNSGAPSDLTSLSPIGWWRMGEEATFSNPGGTGNWTLTDQGSGSNDATSANMEEADKTTDVPT